MVKVKLGDGNEQLIATTRDFVRNGEDLFKWLSLSHFNGNTWDYAFAVINWFCSSKEQPLVIRRGEIFDIYTWENKNANR